MAVQAQYSSNMRNRNVYPVENKNSVPITLFGSSNQLDYQMQQHQIQSQAQNQAAAINGLSNQSPYIPQFTACNRGQQVNGASGLHGSDNEMAWNLLAPRRKSREQELLENSQISSIDFLQTQRNSLPQSAGTVSTGLRLSLDDERLNATSNISAGKSKMSSVLNDDLSAEFQREEADFDQFLRAQGEQFRQALEEKAHRFQMNILACVEQAALRKLRDKDLELESLNKKNMELEDKLKQLSIETHTWQYRAKCSETVINQLKYNIQQAHAQNRESKEGCGDSEVDDAASCFNTDVGDFQAFIYKENRELKEQMTCKACRVCEVSILLLPCRHLCLCKNCESQLDFCPLCNTMKNASMQVFMS